MGFRKDAYAKVWECEDKGKYTKVKLSVSKKNRETGAYETDFSGFVNFVGKAHEKAKKELEANDRIKILACDVSNNYDKEKSITYTNYAVFEWEQAGTTAGESKPAPAKAKSSKAAPAEENDDELPF